MTDPNIAFATKLKTYSEQSSKYGDWIPDTIKKILRNGKTLDLTACVVFSKICYWFLPRRNGNKKFNGSQLRLSINDLSRQTYLSYGQVKVALQNLENKYKYISRTNVGKYTYINLNTEIIVKAITLYEPNFADKEEVIGKIMPIHIHKGKQKVLPRINGYQLDVQDVEIKIESLSTKIDSVESVLEEKQSIIDSCYLSYESFLVMCNHTKTIYNTKLKHGLSEPDLLRCYVLDTKSNIVNPAFSKLIYLYKQMRIDFELLSVADSKFAVLLQGVRTECSKTPIVYQHIKTVMDDIAFSRIADVMKFDEEQAQEIVKDRVSKLKSEKKDLANMLLTYTSELKQIKTKV
jgi:hypothetical protein